MAGPQAAIDPHGRRTHQQDEEDKFHCDILISRT
jgi:hypothetical protein